MRRACYLNPGRDLATAVNLARRVEALGYDSAWVTHGLGRDSFVVLAAYGAATSRLGLGNGVVPVYPRHPVAMAQAALTLSEATGGRFRLGIGVSHRARAPASRQDARRLRDRRRRTARHHGQSGAGPGRVPERAHPLLDAALLQGDARSRGPRRAHQGVRSRRHDHGRARRRAGLRGPPGRRTYIYGCVPPCRSDTAGGPTDHLPRRALVYEHARRGGEILARALTWLVALVVVGCSSVSDSRGLPADRRASVVYVALGDSTVQGVGASSKDRNYVSRLLSRLRTLYPNARVVNLGIGGATSADVLAGQLDQAIELKPDLVTLSIGPNDITQGVPVESYEHNVEAILRRLNDKTRAVIVVNLLPDLAVTPRFRGRPQEATVGRLTMRFNDALRGQATAIGAEVVDLYEVSREEVPRRPELVGSDGYHPSDVGYERWAELMWQGIERRIRHGG